MTGINALPSIALGTGKKTPYLLLNSRQSSLASSRCWTWSSPIGTCVALKKIQMGKWLINQHLSELPVSYTWQPFRMDAWDFYVVTTGISKNVPPTSEDFWTLPVVDQDLQIRGGGGLQKSFQSFGPQFGLKIKGGTQAPRPKAI